MGSAGSQSADRATVNIQINFNLPASACQIYYDLIIISVKTLHTLVFFCKFPDWVACRKKPQTIKKTGNNGKTQHGGLQKSNLCKMGSASPANEHAIIMPDRIFLIKIERARCGYIDIPLCGLII